MKGCDQLWMAAPEEPVPLPVKHQSELDNVVRATFKVDRPLKRSYAELG